MVTSFCSKLGWHSLELLLGQFQDRLQFGIHRELIELCRLTCLNGQRARVLFNAGIDSIAVLANSKVADVENLLQNCAPFESAKAVNGESDREAQERKQLRSFWVTGQKGVTEGEAALLIVEEAREILQKDLGVQISNWTEFEPPEILKKSVLSPNSAHMSYLKAKTKKNGAKRPRRKKAEKSSDKTHSFQIKISEMSPKEKQNSSFDMSAQIEEIFVEEEFQQPLEPVKKKRVSWGDKENEPNCKNIGN